jgi:hypothetical protein
MRDINLFVLEGIRAKFPNENAEQYMALFVVKNFLPPLLLRPDEFGVVSSISLQFSC